MRVEFRLLGGVEAWVDGTPVDLGHVRQRLVLGALLVDVNRTVSADRLVERVWGDKPTPGVRGTLYSYLSRLRQALSAVDVAGPERVRGGYTLSSEPDAVDLHRFRALVARAGASSTDGEAAALFDEAFTLCHSPAFGDIDTPWARSVRESFDQERFGAELDHHDVLLRRGEHARLVTALESSTRQYPLDERLTGQLMLALYRSGRQADALAHYERSRKQLSEELGIGPGPALRGLHQQILTADPALAASTPAAPDGRLQANAGPAMTVPRQLPTPPALFTGRDSELAELSTALDTTPDTGGTVVISAIGGSGGIGKTYLALHWAHAHLEDFPDGQLYTDLRGFDPSTPPLTTTEALRAFLTALGVRPGEVPSTVDAQAGLYRSLTADRRMLILLDNAHDTDQVTALLPGTPTCTVIITSRNQLSGLTTRHGAKPLPLDTLPDTDARQLLTRHLGTARITAEPEAADTLLRCCAGLPLALAIVAARAATQPDFPLTALAEELHDTTGRLDALDTGDITANLRAAFDASHHHLTPDTAHTFALLGLAPGPDISLHAAASLTSQPLPRTRTLLRELHTAHLIHQHRPGRYRMHDLVRLYAAEHAKHTEKTDQTEQTDETPDQALRRLTDFYIHTAQHASLTLRPHQPIGYEPDPATTGVTPQPLADQAAATHWYTQEAPCLLAVQQLAADHGWHHTAWQLPWALYHYDRTPMDYHDYHAMWRSALTAAQHLDEPHHRAVAHFGLGHSFHWTGRGDEALHHLEQGLALFEQSGNLPGQAHTHLITGIAYDNLDAPQRALPHTERALTLYRRTGDRTSEATALNNLGWYNALLGDYEQAEQYCQQALNMSTEQNDHQCRSEVLDSLGYIAHKTGRLSEALDYYHRCLTLAEEFSTPDDVAVSLDCVGDVRHDLGEHAEARQAWQRAATLYRSRRLPDMAEPIQDKLDALDDSSKSNGVSSPAD